MTVKLLSEHHLEFLSTKGGCTGSAEYTLVKMSHYWKSHATAYLINCMSVDGSTLKTGFAAVRELSHMTWPRGYKTLVHSQTQNKAQ